MEAFSQLFWVLTHRIRNHECLQASTVPKAHQRRSNVWMLTETLLNPPWKDIDPADLHCAIASSCDLKTICIQPPHMIRQHDSQRHATRANAQDALIRTRIPRPAWQQLQRVIVQGNRITFF